MRPRRHRTIGPDNELAVLLDALDIVVVSDRAGQPDRTGRVQGATPWSTSLQMITRARGRRA